MKSDTRHFFELLFGMTEKELRARYKHTFFGFLWIIVNPLLQMFVIGFIFRLFIKEPIRNYYLYLFPGLLIWNFFSLTLTKATPSIVTERALIKKAKFQRSIIPLSILLSNFVHLFLAFLLLFISVIYMGTLSQYWFLQIILSLTLLFVFTVGMSLLTTSLNVRYRDVNFFVQAALILWFYATPIVYSIAIIPRKLIWLWRINPLTSIVQLLQSAFAEAPLPGKAMLLINSALIILVTCLGIYFFNKESKYFDDWL